MFNYVFSNGDAHLKNFSLFRSVFGDYVLTPAYDLLCTSLHFPGEARTALDLFDTFETGSFRLNAFYKRPDFLKLGELYGIKPPRARMMLDAFAQRHATASGMINRSYLSAQAKTDLTNRLQDRLRAIEN